MIMLNPSSPASTRGSTQRLMIVPALTASAGPNDSFILTRKFVDGVLEYVKLWPGPVVVAMERSREASDNLDQVLVRANDQPFSLVWADWRRNAPELRAMMASSAVVLASLVDRHVHLAATCTSLGVPVVYIAEYSERTRRQIVHAETSNPILRWRRELWTTRLEREYEAAVNAAAGVQCNGTPTYDAYRDLNQNVLLYFDTRVRKHQLVSSATLERRTSHMLEGKPLRLAFSGRLIPMKGADHLPLVAAELKKRGVPFTLDICGDGAQKDQIQHDIDRLDLNQEVRLRGVLDFHKELMPFISSSVDLFVCCHRQGDPSCTYLETMSCGTPIAGYDNEAFRGVREAAGAGWLSPMNDPAALAQRIAALHLRRSALVQGAFDSRAFASRHTFETTMQARIDHLLSCRKAERAVAQEAAA